MKHFNQHTGLEISQISAGKLVPHTGDVDGAVEIVVNNKKHTFLVDVQNELRQIHVPQVVGRLAGQAAKWLLVTQYISKPNRALLKQQGINYLDVSGNCYIRDGSLLMYINDIPVTPQRQSAEGKLWKPAGLKLVFAFLQNPGLANLPYRTIAAQSGISLGSIGGLLKEMKNEGYLQTIHNNSALTNKDEMLHRWSGSFQSTLRPKLLQSTFRFATPNDRDGWKTRPLREAWWGGEPAGALLSGYLQPEKFILYSHLPKADIMKQLHLLPDADGELELRHPFWNTANYTTDHQACVPTVLAYAELNTSLDSRNRETAERIKAKYSV